jgi:hypothetical protein
MALQRDIADTPPDGSFPFAAAAMGTGVCKALRKARKPRSGAARAGSAAANPGDTRETRRVRSERRYSILFIPISFRMKLIRREPPERLKDNAILQYLEIRDSISLHRKENALPEMPATTDRGEERVWEEDLEILTPHYGIEDVPPPAETLLYASTLSSTSPPSSSP